MAATLAVVPSALYQIVGPRSGGGTPMVPCRTFFDSSLFLGRVAAEDLLNNFVDLLVVFFRAGVRVDDSARHAAPHHRTGIRKRHLTDLGIRNCRLRAQSWAD